MTYKVLIPQDVAQPGKDYLRERGYEIKMGSGISLLLLQEIARMRLESTGRASGARLCLVDPNDAGLDGLPEPQVELPEGVGIHIRRVEARLRVVLAEVGYVHAADDTATARTRRADAH